MPDVGLTIKASDPTYMVDLHGDYLFRFAMSRVHDPSAAEDLVQETFLAAIRNRERFEGRSAKQTWLTGILRNKIMDHFRNLHSEEHVDIDMFDEAGSWMPETEPRSWERSPFDSVAENEFSVILRTALADIPERLRSVFVLRVIEGLDTRSICVRLSISESNYWTSLHRARLAIRQRIERHMLAKVQQH